MIVLYLNNSPLVLTDVRRGRKGRVSSAWVVNGAWTLRLRGDRAQACERHRVVTSSPVREYEEVIVPYTPDYEWAIQKADAKRGTA